jgi:predicted MFS family arabinose efflux permease
MLLLFFQKLHLRREQSYVDQLCGIGDHRPLPHQDSQLVGPACKLVKVTPTHRFLLFRFFCLVIQISFIITTHATTSQKESIDMNSVQPSFGRFSKLPATSGLTKSFHSKRMVTTPHTSSIAAEIAVSRGGGTVKYATASPVKNPMKLPIPSKTNDARIAENEQQQTRILMWIRLLYLSYYASLGSLMPYLPVYYDSLGHSGQIIGLLGAVKPFTTFVVAPVWGLISDSVTDPFTVLSLTYAVSLAGQLLVVLRSDPSYITTMVFVTALFNAPVKSLLDSLVMEVLPPSLQGAAYGRLRLWGQLGFGLGSSGVGLLLSHSSGRSVPLQSPRWWSNSEVIPSMVLELFDFLDQIWCSATSYRLLFLVHAAMSVPTWICIQTFRHLNKKKKSSNTSDLSTTHSPKKASKADTTETRQKNGVVKGLILLSRNTDALLFFFLVFVVGTSSGVIENFAYVRMREVGGTGKEMGLSRLVSSMAGAPMFWFSGPLTQALGADRVLILSLCSYVARFVIYAAMRNPYHGLPAEALRGVTFAAFWSTSTIYAHRVSPPGLHATMLMFLNAMYGGLGQSLGSIIGGKLQQRFGTVITFWYAAVFDTMFVAFLVLYLYCFKENAASGFKDPQPIQESPVRVSKIKRLT